MTILEEAFKRENYFKISFSFNGAGHPTIPLVIKNEIAIFLLDTGAASNILDFEFAKKLSFPLVLTGQKGGGAGGLIHDIYNIGIVDLFYNKIRFSFDKFYAMNLSTVREALKAKGVRDDFKGILGFSFFKKYNCFIDYSNKRIYVKLT